MNRRSLLQGVLAGGTLGVIARSLATGLPVSFLLDPRRAHADTGAPGAVLMMLNGEGDPLNANCPGSYVDGVQHPKEFEGALTAQNGAGPVVGGLKGAAPWAHLPAELRQRLAFLHHTTEAVAHNQFTNVLRLNQFAKGSTGNGQEMLPSLLAQELYSSQHHIQQEPISVGKATLTARGNALFNYSPKSLKYLLTDDTTNTLASLADLREETIAALYQDMKDSGLPAQKAFLDRYLLSRTEAASLGDKLSELLSSPAAEEEDPSGYNHKAQIFTALSLLLTGVTPVVAVWIPFGGDNHYDDNLETEAEQTRIGVGAIEYLWQQLTSPSFAELKDRLTFCNLNVFGRTLKGTEGRQHNAKHHVMTVFGPTIKPMVAGGLSDMGKDLGAARFRSATGKIDAGGDVTTDLSLGAVGRTVAAAAGIPKERLDKRIPGVPTITAVLKA